MGLHKRLGSPKKVAITPARQDQNQSTSVSFMHSKSRATWVGCPSHSVIIVNSHRAHTMMKFHPLNTLVGFIFIFSISENLVLVTGDCWWSGCQPLSWGERGCPAAGYITKDSSPCEDGDKFHCCTDETPPPTPPKPGCWWSGCQPLNWGERGCAAGFKEIDNHTCTGGDMYHCCESPESKLLITLKEFNSAAETKGGNPNTTVYDGFIKSLPLANITTKMEAAKYLAHTCWETVGFKYTKEILCQKDLEACLKAYPSRKGGYPDKVYYGRGMIQLTWDYNYKAASLSLYGDERLLTDPDQVGDDPEIGWATAAWYWAENVHNHSKTFGSTLFKINGALECDGGLHAENRVKRFNHYKQILQLLKLATPPDSDGQCSSNRRRRPVTRRTTLPPTTCKTE